MKLAHRAIAAVLLVTFLPIIGLADGKDGKDPHFDQALPMSSDAKTLSQAVDQYVESYQPESESQQKFSSEEAEMSSDFDQLNRKDQGHEIALQAAKLGNGGTWLSRNLNQAFSVARRLSASDNQTYNDFLARLMIDYYQHPKHREAIASLVDKLNKEVAPQIRGRDPNLFANAMAKGVFYAQLALCLWDWRQSKPGGVKRDAVRLYEEGSSLWTKLAGKIRSGEFVANAAREEEAAANAIQKRRAAEFAVDLLDTSRKAVISGAKTLGRRVKGAPKAAAQSAVELGQTVTEVWETRSEIPGKMRKGISLKNLKKLGVALAKASRGLILGAAYGAYEWNRESDLQKANPKLALQFIQTYALSELEADVIEETSRFLEKFPQDDQKYDLDHSVACSYETIKTEIERLRDDTEDYSSQLAHFRSSAPQLIAKVELVSLDPSDNDRARDSRWKAQMNPVRAFILSSKDLSKTIRETRLVVENVRKSKGMQTDETRVGFDGVEIGIRSMKTGLEKLEAALMKFEQLNSTERGQMTQGCTPKQP